MTPSSSLKARCVWTSTYEPEPDLVLLRPRADFYSSRHGSPEDVLLIIEIADSSLESTVT